MTTVTTLSESDGSGILSQNPRVTKLDITA